LGIWAVGALLYTLMLKVAIPIYTGSLRFSEGTTVAAKEVSGQESVLTSDHSRGDLIPGQSG
jgi:hypothetical protein